MEVGGRVVLEDSRWMIRALSGNHSVRSMGSFIEIPGDGLCSVLLESRPGDVVVDVRSESAAMSSTTQRKSSVEDVTTSCWPGSAKRSARGAWTVGPCKGWSHTGNRFLIRLGAWRRRVNAARLPKGSPSLAQSKAPARVNSTPALALSCPCLSTRDHRSKNHESACDRCHGSFQRAGLEGSRRKSLYLSPAMRLLCDVISAAPPKPAQTHQPIAEFPTAGS